MCNGGVNTIELSAQRNLVMERPGNGVTETSYAEILRVNMTNAGLVKFF